MSNETPTCSNCGHSHGRHTAFCHECGTSFRKISKHRAIALVEGTAGIGKTTLVDELVHHYLNLNPHVNTFVRLGQGHTYSPLNPDSGEPAYTTEEQLNYLDQVYDTLVFLSHPSGPNSKPPVSCIIETLHLTLSTKPNILSEEEIAGYDRKLAGIGCKLIVIQVSSDVLWERCIWERRSNGFVTKYGRKYGDSLEAIHAHYLQEQEQMLDLFERSTMDKLLLNGGNPIDDLARTAYEFWIGTPIHEG